MSDYARPFADRSKPLRQPSPARGTEPAAAPHPAGTGYAPPETGKLHQLKAGLTGSPQVSRLEGLTALLNGPRTARPTTQLAGTPINDDEELEREADAMGVKAMQMRPLQMRADPSAEPVPPSPATASVVQRAIGKIDDGTRVQQISTGQIYYAHSNGKGKYNLYEDDSTEVSKTVTVTNKDFVVVGSEADKEEAIELDPDLPYTFTFSLNPIVMKEVKKRGKAVKTPRPKTDAPKKGKAKGRKKVEAPKVEKVDESDYLGIMSDVYEEANKAKGQKDYPTGKARKKKSKTAEQPKTTLTPRYLGTDLSIRLDKTKKGGVYPRIGLKDEADKTTQELAWMVDAYEGESLAAFLAGLKGKPLDEDMDEDAHRDGVEVRSTVMLSDVVDFPGNSVITDRLLQKVENADDYVRLFTGTRKSEYSYGALPSQNRATTIETELERKAPFSKVGTLISKGTLDVSTAPSNVPTLRKLRSLVDADSELLSISTKIGKRKREVSSASYSKYAAGKAMTSRDIKSEKAEEEGVNLFSDVEDASDEEAERLSVLSKSQRQTRLARLKQQREKLDRKIRALEALEEQDVDEESLEEISVGTEKGRERKKAKISAETQNLDDEMQNPDEEMIIEMPKVVRKQVKKPHK